MIPIPINTLDKTEKFLSIGYLKIIETIPTVKSASVYITRLISNATVVAYPGMPSFIIKYALAGCPPDAEGVIAEKYTSAPP